MAAAVLGAALLGIEEEIDPGEPVVGNAYEVEDDLPADRKLPTNLRDSAARLLVVCQLLFRVSGFRRHAVVHIQIMCPGDR